MSNALLPSWANGTVKEAADMLARTALEKQALPSMAELGQTLSGYASKAKDWAKANPQWATPLGTAAVGSGLAGLSSLRQPKEERQTLRSMLRGALAGGALGGGGYYAAKSVGLDKKIPGLFSDANKKVTEMITGAPAAAPAAEAGGAPGAPVAEAPAAKAPEVVDPARTAEEAVRAKNTGIIRQDKEQKRDKLVDDITGWVADKTYQLGKGVETGVRRYGEEAVNNAIWSPEAHALYATGGIDAIRRKIMNNRITANPAVASRGAERLMAGADWQTKLPKQWVEQLPQLQAAAEGPELANALKALKSTKSLQSAALGTEAELSRGLAQRISRAGRGIGGRWGKVLSVLPYALALAAPTAMESASPVIQDALSSARTGGNSRGRW